VLASGMVVVTEWHAEDVPEQIVRGEGKDLASVNADERARAFVLDEATAAITAILHRDLGPARIFMQRLSSRSIPAESLPTLLLMLLGAPCVLLAACCTICAGCYRRWMRAASQSNLHGAGGNKYDRIAVERDSLEAQWQAHVEAAAALSAPTEVASAASWAAGGDGGDGGVGAALRSGPCAAAGAGAGGEACGGREQQAINQSRRMRLQSDETVIMELASEVDYVYPGAAGPPVLMCD